MYKLNKSCLIETRDNNDNTVFSVVSYTEKISEPLKIWNTNTFRGVLAYVNSAGYTDINQKAPLSLVKEIASLIKW